MVFDYTNRSPEEGARISRMVEAWQAYNGYFAPSLQRRPTGRAGLTDDSIIVNRCKPVVDKTTAALSGQGIDFQVADETADGAQDYIDGCFRANKKMAFLQRLFINGAVFGHLFVKIVPALPYPRLIVLDPSTMAVQHMPDDIDRISCYTIQYKATDGNGKDVEYRQMIQQDGSGWQIIDQIKSGNTWITKEMTPWSQTFSPIIDAQNLPNPNNYWGVSDISPDLIQLNRQLNFAYSNINRILKNHAHPKTWVKGIGGKGLKTSPDEAWILPEGAEVGAIEMHSDLSSSLQFAHTLETAMDVLSRTPSLALGDLQDVPRGQVTGPALELMLEPLIEKTRAKQALIGGMLEELCRRLLSLGGFGDDMEVFVRWPEIIPSDPVTTAQVAQMYQALGVSLTTIYSRLNLDYDQEREKKIKEANPLADVNDPQLSNTTPESESEPDEVQNTGATL